jgi:hypothetical protein
MSAFVACKALHVLCAVLGLGTLTAILVVGTSATPALLERLTRTATVALALVFATAVGIDVASHFAYDRLWWFRLSGLSLLPTGVVLALLRHAVRSGVMSRVRPLAAVAAGLVAWITLLMELRPFS